MAAQQPSSSKGPAKADDYSISIADILECPVCLDLCSGQIEQCKNGHNICASHVPKLVCKVCPTCRIPYSKGSSRNRLAEVLVEQKLLRIQKFEPITCKYFDQGCNFQDVTKLTNGHQKECYYRPIPCSFAHGKVEIPFDQYIHHLKKVHKVKTFVYKPGMVLRIYEYFVKSVNGKPDKLIPAQKSRCPTIFILNLNEHKFLVQVARVDGCERKIHAWTSFHGRPEMELKFEVDMRIVGSSKLNDFDEDDVKSENDATPVPTRMKLEEIQEKEVGLSVSEGYIQHCLKSKDIDECIHKYWKLYVDIHER